MTEPAAFWDNAAEKYAADPIKDMDSYLRGMERTLSYLSADARVLEVGCGTGTTALRLAPHVARYEATDVSPAMLDIARQKAAEAGTSVSFQVARTDEPQAGPYDAVLGYNIFHLVQNAPETLARLHAQLKPGGLFISKTPMLGHNPLFRVLIWALRLIGKAPYVGIMKRQEWDRMIETAGFEILETGEFPKRPPSRFIVAKKVKKA